MEILYLSLIQLNLNENGIYPDLINELSNTNHITLVQCVNSANLLSKFNENIDILSVKIQNQFVKSKIKKAISMYTLQKKMMKAIKRNLKFSKFDLVLYATPPITFYKVVKYCKRIYKCKSYLMLKDIFPQNAKDIDLIPRNFIGNFIFNFYKRLEHKLYQISDKIGCMSQKNIEYIVQHNEINRSKLEIFPNAVKINHIIQPERNLLLKYQIDPQKLIFIFGGNLGKPQGLDFLIKGIKAVQNDNIHFIIVGKGTEQEKVFSELKNQKYCTCIKSMPKKEYEELALLCDIGIVSLDHRFTIPNYPSRVLSYMQHGKPVLALTDRNTDIKELIEDEAKCGHWIFSNDIQAFINVCELFYSEREKNSILGKNGYQYLIDHFDVKLNVLKLKSFIEENKNV